MIDIDLENIESFQIYSGGKMQRFNPDTNYGLGEMSFPTYLYKETNVSLNTD